MLKRQSLFTTYSPSDIERVRELVSYRARIDTIQKLMDREHIESAARETYKALGHRPPGGSKSPARKVPSTYTSQSNRLALNTMYCEFADLRSSGFSFVDSLISVYRAYRKSMHWLVEPGQSDRGREDALMITFDHLYAVVLELETMRSQLLRCTSCGSRNLFTKYVAIRSMSCLFCDLIANAKKRSQPVRQLTLKTA